jgi:hypothetical protein
MEDVKTEDVERRCQAVSPNDEPCDHLVTLQVREVILRCLR